MSTAARLALLTVWGMASGVWAEEAPTASQPFRYDPGGRRDPFVALVREGRLTGAAAQSARKDSQSLVLGGILWDPAGGSIALINEEEVTVGGEVNGYRVVEIRSDAVVLSSGGAPLVLRISFDQPPTPLNKKARGTGGEGS